MKRSDGVPKERIARNEIKKMSTRDRQLKELDALERLLDVYGADRTRWPARERLQLASLITDEPEAQRLMAEAVALDRLLDVAPAARTEQEQGLTGRIVAAARGQQHKPLSASQVSPAVSNIVKLPAWVRRPQIARAFGASDWPAAGLLAASLVLGVMLGSAGMLDSTMQEVAEVAGLSSSLTVESQLTLNEDTAAWAGEELL